MKQQKQKILIVDDSPSNIRILGELLKKDCDTFFAANGAKALEITKNEMPDLILLDIVMPDINGFEVCKRIKADPSTSQIPIIFITALGFEEDETKGLEMGAIDFIVKPFNPAIVKIRVQNHLQLKKYQDLLHELSSIDGLTGIANRRRFDDGIDQEFKRALRNKTCLSLILLNVDFFKQYNDFYGHLKGDECLKSIAECISSCLNRSTDLASRYGGEEFVCLMPDLDQKGLFIIGETIRKAIEDLNIPHEKSTVSQFVTVSLGGVSLIPDNNMHPKSFIDQADQKLYQAKIEGRNRLIQ